MTMRVGIPRAMGYYYLYPFFRTLLETLGAEVVLSPPTTPRMLERMDTCPTDEPCLAVKLHFSHADALASRDDIDFLFLPIIARVEQNYCCPKFIGIADMTRHGLELADARVLMPLLEYSDDDRAMLASLHSLAERLGVRSRATLLRAIRQGRAAQTRFRSLCVSEQITTPEAYRLVERGVAPVKPAVAADAPTVAVIGHPYLLYEVVSQGMIERLRACGPVITAEMVDPAAATREVETIEDGLRLWPFEAMLLGAALHLLRQGRVEKMILVGSFECGPESIIESYIEEEAQRHGIPLMLLALDEHSGEAGLSTRLEAFMDTEKTAETPAAAPPTHYLAPHAEIVLGFPSMGLLDRAVRAVVESFGVRTVPTPRTNARTIELGREIAPEFACFPFTATLGQMRVMLDEGANTILMVGGKGYCRLGWYAQVQERLLRNLGYDLRMLVVDSPFPLREKWEPFRQIIQASTRGASWPRVLGAVNIGFHLLQAMDRAEVLAHRLRAFERERGTVNRALEHHLRRLSTTFELATIRRLQREFTEEVAAIDTEETDPLRLRITGEIWVVLEQSATHEVERWLGARAHPRVWVERELTASNWFRGHVLTDPAVLRREWQITRAARPWLSTPVGGHGQNSVGHVALARREHMDGVLHVFPFTCMPEIIAQNILVRVAETTDTPVLTYIVSEQQGEAGMETRLESFLDLLEERRMAGRPSVIA